MSPAPAILLDAQAPFAFVSSHVFRRFPLRNPCRAVADPVNSNTFLVLC